MNPPASLTPVYADQHSLFVGTTGSGKSTRMIRQLGARIDKMRNVPRDKYKIILVDTKPVSYGMDDNQGHYGFLPGAVIYRDWRVIDLTNAPRLLIYRPMEDMISPDEFTGFFRKLSTYRIKTLKTDEKGHRHTVMSPLPLLIIVDELIDIFSSERSRTTYIEGFAKILVQGRSSLQTLWILTQYPVYIDPAIKRNVACNFVFRLPDENDRKVMAGILGFDIVKKPIRDPHGFFYQNAALARTTQESVYFNGKGPAIAPVGRLA